MTFVFCSERVGTKVYLFGGNGHPQGYVCSDPDASLDHLNIESVAHNDLYYFDVSTFLSSKNCQHDAIFQYKQH